MIVRIEKSFQKDVSKINDEKVKKLIIETIKELQATDDIHSIINIKKLSGFKDMYRIRIGNYRMGLEYVNN